ncbi:MAG TPA: bacteriohemerythrin [Gallionella sp.]|nr:bacteriohemerythrin [Gallionella sp.]
MSSVSTIDQQHQVLVGMLNGLNDAVKNKASRNDIYRIIDEIIAYTRLHFATEERLMAQSGYGDVEFHKDKHRQLMQDALHLKGKLADVGEEMFTDWFNHWPFTRVLAHIQFADQQFEEQLLKNVMKDH